MTTGSDLIHAGHRSGFVAIVGLPNVGKSTLVNRVVGEKIAIVTAKPQTTRSRMLGICQRENAQIAFIDTPGVCRDAKALHRFLNAEVQASLESADVILLLVEPDSGEGEAVVVERVREARRPVFACINKIDRLTSRDVLLPRIAGLADSTGAEHVYCVSATTGDGVDDVIDALVVKLPEGPPLYDPEELTTAPLRFIAAEMIREQVFLQTEREVPYSTAVVVNEFRERGEGKGVYITADVVVERDGQKGILIGRGASRLKSIGSAAREGIEALIGERVFLELFVKVRKDWSKDDRALQQLGYR